jgi:glycerol-3-phosphate dehydrogenase
MRLDTLKKDWDLIIIGGGITGAGILRESVRMGLSALLVEQVDFAWGTSSRSSKLVHGGLRYLREGRVGLTRESVKERERLLEEAPGLVEPLGFLVPVYKDRGPGKWTLEAGLSLYDLIARKRQHKYHNSAEFVKLMPLINQKGLLGGFQFFDAQVDDARLVLRLINEALQSGGFGLNYTSATEIARNAEGEVIGITVEDVETRETRHLSTRAVINATGWWAEKLHPSPDPNLHIRPLRGSHLIFPARVLPINQAISFSHPADHRAVFALPWEGVILVGTTDLDHDQGFSIEPFITKEEISYLLKGVQDMFPSLGISINDCISTIAGVRPVLSKGKLAPSEESREHVVWVDRGLVTITGGKLTTFRRLAWDALKAARPSLPSVSFSGQDEPVFSAVPANPREDFGLSPETWRRLYGRYGESANDLVRTAAAEDLSFIPGTHILWAELPFTARYEQVRHLPDLLLRRVRLGLLVPQGGEAYLNRVRNLCRPVLPWDSRRWKWEIDQYMNQWKHAYGLPAELYEITSRERMPLGKKVGDFLRKSRLFRKLRTL